MMLYPENIPQELKDKKIWTCIDKQKHSFNPLTGTSSNADDPNTWADFQSCLNAVNDAVYPFLSFSLPEGYTVIEIENCYSGYDYSDFTKDLLERCESYAEETESGFGLRIICKGKSTSSLSKTRVYKQRVNVYSGNRLVTITGHVLDDRKRIAYCQAFIDQIHDEEWEYRKTHPLERSSNIQEMTFHKWIPFQSPLSITNIDRENAIPFPVDCLPDWIRDMVKEVSRVNQVDESMPAMAALGALSVCLTGEYQMVVTPTWKEDCNLYLLLVSHPASGKSPVLSIMMDPIYETMDSYNEEHAKEIRAYQRNKLYYESQIKTLTSSKGNINNSCQDDSVIKKIEEIEMKLEDLKKHEIKELNFIGTDSTPEAVVQSLKENNEVYAIVHAEGGIFKSMTGLYSSGIPNLGIFKSACNGERNNEQRVIRGQTYVKHPLLTMCLFVQPSVLKDLLNNQAVLSEGLMQRFMIALPVSKVGTRVPPSKIEAFDLKIKDNYYSKMKNMILMYKVKANTNIDLHQPERIYLSPDAKKEYDQFFVEIEEKQKNASEHEAEALEKLKGFCYRIALLLKIGSGDINSNPLSKTVMSKAIEIIKYFEKTDEVIYSNASKEETDAQVIWNAGIIKMIKESSEYPDFEIPFITKRDLQNKLQRKFNRSNDLNNGLKELEERGYIRIFRDGKSTKIKINPEAIRD